MTIEMTMRYKVTPKVYKNLSIKIVIDDSETPLKTILDNLDNSDYIYETIYDLFKEATPIINSVVLVDICIQGQKQKILYNIPYLNILYDNCAAYFTTAVISGLVTMCNILTLQLYKTKEKENIK